MELTSAATLIEKCETTGWDLAQAALEYEAARSGRDQEQIRAAAALSLEVMRQSVERGRISKSRLARLVQGYGVRLQTAADAGRLLGDSLLDMVVIYAISAAQSNAELGRIVACPTAGSCGVVPGVLLPLAEQRGVEEARLVDCLLAAGVIGVVSAAQGPISGAEGGCQAECGVAAAMAAGAAVYMADGSLEQIFSAAAFALQNMLGLVCDPVAGLVEVPCVTRNASAAANALVCADLALAGIVSPIPFDETVAAMKQVGRMMPEVLRETAKGGLAATPSARRIHQALKQENTLN